MAISSYWQNHINAWQNSRLSQAAYCRQHNLKYGTFTNRLSILRAKQIVTPASELVQAVINARRRFRDHIQAARRNG